MGGNDKHRIINWTYVSRTNGSPRTLEFRQHAGTLSPVDIEHWLAFVVGMVRLAEYNGRKYGGAGEGYKGEGYEFNERKENENEKEEEGASVWNLMKEGMEMGEEEVEWWKENREWGMETE